MSNLQIIDLLCEITSMQAELIKEMAVEIEHTKQMSNEIKQYYRDKIQDVDTKMDVAEYHCRKIIDTDDVEKHDKDNSEEA